MPGLVSGWGLGCPGPVGAPGSVLAQLPCPHRLCLARIATAPVPGLHGAHGKESNWPSPSLCPEGGLGAGAAELGMGSASGCLSSGLPCPARGAFVSRQGAGLSLCQEGSGRGVEIPQEVSQLVAAGLGPCSEPSGCSRLGGRESSCLWNSPGASFCRLIKGPSRRAQGPCALAVGGGRG